MVNLSVLSHFSLYFLLKHFTSSGNSNNKPPMHSNSPYISLISNFSLYVTQIISPQCTRIVTQPRVPSHCYYMCNPYQNNQPELSDQFYFFKVFFLFWGEIFQFHFILFFIFFIYPIHHVIGNRIILCK